MPCPGADFRRVSEPVVSIQSIRPALISDALPNRPLRPAGNYV